MPEKDKNGIENDDFWNLDEFAVKRPSSLPPKQFSKSAVEAVSIDIEAPSKKSVGYSDGKLTSRIENDQGTITRFIPPHKDSVYTKKYVLFEYEPKNPLIRSVKLCSDRLGDQIFSDGNLFMRERRALLHRTVSESPYTSYYSYSPRYSQMSRAQLNYYLWWRENTRNGVFLKADESYIILYAYELAATGENEDKQAALRMLCSLLTNYTDKDVNVVFKMMIRDVICDFCLVHGLSLPLDELKILGRQLISNSYLPEFFVDLSERNRDAAIELGISAISMYDYRKSKFYSPETSDLFKKAMNGSVAAVFSDNSAFNAVTAFTGGVYGCVTTERHPFARMVNVVNKSVRLEVTYYQLSNIQSAITDAMRYSENRLREHLGIKNKLHIMSVNPAIKSAIDNFYDNDYPPMPIIDRRRKNAKEAEAEINEYDRLYDLPKTEISPERALEIERESWNTTKILTEAFADDISVMENDPEPLNAPELMIEPVSAVPEPQVTVSPETTAFAPRNTSNGSLSSDIKAILGDIADFISLCRSPSPTSQRAFASSHGLSLDEIADRINETAVDVFGDILLEDVGGAYGIIEDYVDQI